MKSIKNEISLQGKFERISAMDFRKQPGEVLESAKLGKTFLITKAGKPIAVLSGLPGEQLTIRVNSNGSIDYDL